jgi:hypothetical protein
MRLQIARTRSEALQCQHLIAEVYNRAYEVVFSDDSYDLEAKVEPWPHRYLMGLVKDELVATVGLYTHETYVERFGNVSNAEINALICAAGAAPRFSAATKREITKLAVRLECRGRGYGRFVLACANSRFFLQDGRPAEEPAVLVSCGKRSIWEELWHAAGIHTRPIKAFPRYKVHELYCSPQDPMDSRLVLPEVDIPKRWYDRQLPGDYEVER